MHIFICPGCLSFVAMPGFIAHKSITACALIAQSHYRHSCSYILCLFLYVETCNANCNLRCLYSCTCTGKFVLCFPTQGNQRFHFRVDSSRCSDDLKLDFGAKSLHYQDFLKTGSQNIKKFDIDVSISLFKRDREGIFFDFEEMQS